MITISFDITDELADFLAEIFHYVENDAVTKAQHIAIYASEYLENAARNKVFTDAFTVARVDAEQAIQILLSSQ